MIKIKPSEGITHRPGTIVRVTGRIAGTVLDSKELGGRWVVPICDPDEEMTSKPPAFLSINRNPDENKALPPGVKKPLSGVEALFSEELFRPLFRRGALFQAQAVIGIEEGKPWYNVSHVLLFEPDIPVGVQQILREPTCARQILLSCRGVRGYKKSGTEDSRGGVIIGDLVHAILQAVAASSERAKLRQFFEQDPDKLFIQFLPWHAVLKTALGMIGASPRASDGVIVIAKKHLANMLGSSSVMELISDRVWKSETSVVSPAIDGRIDLRTEDTIIEIKTVSEEKKNHREQIELYLVGDMLEFGVDQVLKNHKGYLVFSSGRIKDDAQRVVQVQSPISMLNRFLTARHRYLLASGHHTLPRIEWSANYCKDCYFFMGDPDTGDPSACHFYCQTDRTWGCREEPKEGSQGWDCPHLSVCEQSHCFHSYEVLDDANRIRSALLNEIKIYRQEKEFPGTPADWEGQFTIREIHQGGLLVLQPSFGAEIDSPYCGSEVQIFFESVAFPLKGEVILNGFNADQWWVFIYGTTSCLKVGMACRMLEQRGRLGRLFSLLSCVDALQRNINGNSAEGIAFAGGRVVSGKLQTFNNLKDARESGATDIFCQSFGLRESRRLLKELLDGTSGRVLIITENPNLGEGFHAFLHLNTRYLQEILKGFDKVRGALHNLKNHLESQHVWVASPAFVFSDYFEYLPNRGKDFFDYLVIYQTGTITALEYYLIREYAKKRICVGDANCIGRPMSSPLAIRMGLGDNVLHRVTTRGFPKTNDSFPVVVKREKQELLPTLNAGLGKCRMETLASPKDTGEIKLIPHKHLPVEHKMRESFDEFLVDVSDEAPRKIKLRANKCLSENEAEYDLKNLKFSIFIEVNKSLTSPISGNTYTILSPPQPLQETDPNLPPGKWLVFVQKNSSLHEASNEGEAEIVAELIKDLLGKSVKPKNLAVISPFAKQLELIRGFLDNESTGICLRTPYNIRGESWGTVVISCVLGSLVDSKHEIVNPRFFYTMLRASINRVIVVGHESFIQNHPLMRNIEA
ncbi:MAG: AAA domain-containing protein [Candidatus Hodarchaeota archaeon]